MADFPKHDLSGRHEVPSTTAATTAPAPVAVEAVAWRTDIFESMPNGRMTRLILDASELRVAPDADWTALVPASALSSLQEQVEGLTRERDSLADELEDAKQLPWPRWAEEITKKLQSYGVEVDEFDGWDLPNDLDEWLAGAIEVETGKLEARLTAAEAEVTRLRAALEPFVGDKMPSLRRTEIGYDGNGLRRRISPMELAMLAARRARKEPNNV